MLKQLVCLAAGVGIGYYLRQHIGEKDFQERLDQAREEIRVEIDNEYVKKMTELMKEKVVDLVKDYSGETADIPEEPVVVPMPEPVAKALTNYSGIARRIPPTAFAKDFHVEGEPEDQVADFIPDENENRPEFLREVPEPPMVKEFVEGEAPARVAFVPPSRNPVNIIDEATFMANEDGYPEYTLEYWSGNGVLSNVEGEPIDDKTRDEILGREGLKMLTETPEALVGDSLYIRHTGLKRVFEIIRNDDTFEGA